MCGNAQMLECKCLVSQMNALYIHTYVEEEHFKPALYARTGSGRAMVHFLSEICM